MLADPQSVNVGAGAVSLPRVGIGPSSGLFQDTTGNLKFKIEHTVGKRIRRVVRLDIRKTAADVLFPAQNAPYNMAVYTVFDLPLVGFSGADQVSAYTGYAAMLAASSYLIIGKVLGAEV